MISRRHRGTEKNASESRTVLVSSWLNVIERWFRDITQNRIRNGVFHNVPQLIKAIRDYIDHHNANPTTFVFTKMAADILEKVARARASLNKIPSA
jgi:hypothetical protein